MKKQIILAIFTSISICSFTLAQTTRPAVAAAPATQPIQNEFNDPDTGARIMRLSRNTTDESTVIYFHQPCITADGKYALTRTLSRDDGHTAGTMFRFDFEKKITEPLTDRMTRNQVLAPKSGNMYYSSDKDTALYVTNVYTKETHKLADMPDDVLCTGGVTVNCDESLVVGTAGLREVMTTKPTLTTPPNQGPAFNDTFNKHETNILFSIDIKSGKYKELHRINTWLGHTQFSPVDPKKLMYCHEGPWGQVDRIWTIEIKDGAEPVMGYKRSVQGEIAGHEFWSNDGKTAWFDNSLRGANGFHFLKGRNIETGEIKQFPITSDFGSIHYRWSPDGKFLVSDGGGRSPAMFILVPQSDNTLKPIKLCSMSRNDYKAAEPNPHMTPDQHWVLFTATFFGTPQAWAVETPKEFWRN